MKADRGYRPELDGIRGIAIALVVFSHASGSTGLSGQIGVTLFFVLSGYLITGLLMAEHAATGGIGLRSFYLRRARRLLPALTLFLGVSLVVGWVARDAAIAIALYVANWVRVADAPIGYLGHTWSLGIEEQFYLLWPLAFIAGLRSPRVLLALVASVVALRFAADGPFAMWSTVTRADGLLLGCAIALAGWRTNLMPFGIVALLAVSLGPSMGYDFGITAGVLASALIVAGARPGLLSARPLVWLGGISYSLYLWHLPIIGATHWPPAISVLTAVAIAWASTRYVESPIRRWGSAQSHDHDVSVAALAAALRARLRPAPAATTTGPTTGPTGP